MIQPVLIQQWRWTCPECGDTRDAPSAVDFAGRSNAVVTCQTCGKQFEVANPHLAPMVHYTLAGRTKEGVAVWSPTTDELELEWPRPGVEL